MRRGFHYYFFHVLFHQPLGQFPQFAWIGTQLSALKLVLTLDCNISDYDCQHPLVYIDSCYSVWHRHLLAGAERMPQIRYSGSQAIAAFRVNTTTPTVLLNTHAPDHPIHRLQRLHWFVDLTARATDSLPNTNPIFMTSRELYFSRLLHWNTLFQLFCPVHHDVDFAWACCCGRCTC